MTLSSKYGCGCSAENVKQFGHQCCSTPVQSAPSPCCEAHNVLYQTGVCFYSVCDVTATEEPFFLTFGPGSQNGIPMNMSEVYFYHQAAGLIKIISFDGTSFRCALKDASKAGAQIRPSDCVALAVIPQTLLSGAVANRCLSGNFLAPANGNSAPIFILNGSGIPNGSNITFTYLGETGTYVVLAYLSSTGNRYAYTVQNTGSGLTPNTMVEGGDDGACTVPIELITDVDVCNLSATQVLDKITGCYNGSPRAFVPTGPNQAPVSGVTAPYPFQLRTLANLDCCVEIDGVLKFTAAEGCTAIDTVHLRDINLDCFQAAYDLATARNNHVPLVIGNLNFIVTSWDSGSKNITLQPVGDVYNGADFVQFSSGTRLCTGDCCNSCVNGPQTTDATFVGNPEHTFDANFALANPGNLPTHATNPLSYLVGWNQAGTAAVLLLDTSYHTGLQPLPKMSDPLLLRQKICNSDNIGCDQDLAIDFNILLEIVNLPVLMRCCWEFGHFLANSATLEDGVTPNPNHYASTAAKYSGYIDGPTQADTTVTAGTGLGYGDSTLLKHYPFGAGFLRDYSRLKKCDCLTSILYLHIRLIPLTSYAGGVVNVLLNTQIRRKLTKTPVNQLVYPANNYSGEGWN